MSGTPTMQDVTELKGEVKRLKSHVADLEARIEELESDAGLLDDGPDEYEDAKPSFVGEASAFEEADPGTLRTLADVIEEMEAER